MHCESSVGSISQWGSLKKKEMRLLNTNRDSGDLKFSHDVSGSSWTYSNNLGIFTTKVPHWSPPLAMHLTHNSSWKAPSKYAFSVQFWDVNVRN